MVSRLKMLVVKCKWQILLGRPKCRFNYNIKIDLTQIESKYSD